MIGLKGRTGMLVDEMRRLRKKCISRGVGVRGKSKGTKGLKEGNKRLSIENGSARQGDNEAENLAEGHSEAGTGNGKRRRISDRGSGIPSTNGTGATSTSSSWRKNRRPAPSPAPASDLYPTLPLSGNQTSTTATQTVGKSTSAVAGDNASAPDSPAQEQEYVPHYISLTEEVHRRLYASRLAHLASLPRTSQKRKFEDLSKALGTLSTSSANGSPNPGGHSNAGGEKETGKLEEGQQEPEGSPVKKIRTLAGPAAAVPVPATPASTSTSTSMFSVPGAFPGVKFPAPPQFQAQAAIQTQTQTPGTKTAEAATSGTNANANANTPAENRKRDADSTRTPESGQKNKAKVPFGFRSVKRRRV
jgi:hypothetical protein